MSRFGGNASRGDDDLTPPGGPVRTDDPAAEDQAEERAEDPSAPSAVGGPRRLWQRLPAGFLFSLLVYLASRIPVLGTVVYYLRQHPRVDVSGIVLRRDGWWYVTIAEHGYSTSVRHPFVSLLDGHHNYSDWAFFPGYALAIRGLHEATRLPYVPASLVAAGIFGFLAVWATYALGREFGGVRVGQGSALLVAAWPGSAALTWPYSEGLFVAATAMSLLHLHRRRWLLAGAFGALATLTRPNGLALVAAAGVVAVVELVRRREWRALVAPVLAAGGALAFVGFGWWRTGDLLIWRHAENLWAQELDFGRALIQQSLPVLRNPSAAQRTGIGQLLLQTARLDILGAALLVVFVVAAALNRRRLTVAMVVYSLVSVFLIVGSSQVATRPRTLLAVLPGFVWLAAAIPRWLAAVVAVVFLPLLVLTTYAWLWMVTP